MSVLILCYHYTTSAFRGRDSNPDQSLEIRSNTRSLLLLLSEKRGSNPRPPPWQGGALPTELFSHYLIFSKSTFKNIYFEQVVGFEPTM
jgi:hypothetical protein